MPYADLDDAMMNLAFQVIRMESARPPWVPEPPPPRPAIHRIVWDVSIHPLPRVVPIEHDVATDLPELGSGLLERAVYDVGRRYKAPRVRRHPRKPPKIAPEGTPEGQYDPSDPLGIRRTRNAKLAHAQRFGFSLPKGARYDYAPHWEELALRGVTREMVPTGAELAAERRGTDLSQRDLAHIDGCSRGLVAEIERGRRRQPTTIYRLAQIVRRRAAEQAAARGILPVGTMPTPESEG